MTETLLIIGMATAVVFVVVILVEGARRPGYDPIYHTGSELELGPRGWVQKANFFLVGTGMFAFAVGVHDTLDTLAGATLLSIFGLGMIVAGAFAPDAVRGYPPGAPRNPRARPTWVGLVHNISGPISFVVLLAGSLTVAGRLDGAWRLYTLVTAVAGLVLTIGTGLAFQQDAARTGLVQRGLLVASFGWITLLGLHLLTDVSPN
jgi:hypothetical protein